MAAARASLQIVRSLVNGKHSRQLVRLCSEDVYLYGRMTVYITCVPQMAAAGELRSTARRPGNGELFCIIGVNGKTDQSPVQNGDRITLLQTYDGIHYLSAENGGGRGDDRESRLGSGMETFTVNIVTPSVSLCFTRIIHISDLHFTDFPKNIELGSSWP